MAKSPWPELISSTTFHHVDLYPSLSMQNTTTETHTIQNIKWNKWNSCKAQPLNLISMAPPLSTSIQTATTKSTPIQNAKLNNWSPSKMQPPIWSPWLHHSHRFKQAPATETDSKTHHQFNNPRRFNPQRRFNNTRRFNPPLKPSHWFNFNTRIETQPTHLWNPADSNHHFKPSKHRFNPTKNNQVKRKKNIERKGETEK